MATYKKSIKKGELMAKLGNFVSVCNTESRNGYGTAPNQFEIRFENGSVFQSYSSFIGARVCGQLYIGSYHDCSNTTSGHFGRWCGYNCKERRKGLAEGKFIFVEED